MARIALAALVLISAAFGLTAGGKASTRDTTFLDNGSVRVGVDLAQGDKITFLAKSSGPSTNLVQDVQPSYYAGPAQNSWHAFSSGSVSVLESSNDGRTIHTLTQAAQEFAGSCQCTFEQWITLDGRAVVVRNRLQMFRTDTTQYPAQWQELPALYTTGAAYRVFTYSGGKPFTKAPVREITEDAGNFFRPGPNWAATEHWAALVGDDRFGVGLVEPGMSRFNGTPGTREGTGNGWVNGYLTAASREILDANATYEYSYRLVVGTVAQIRAYAYAHRPDPRPSYRFVSDRRHWWYVNASDRGWPIAGALRVLPHGLGAQLVGPEGRWQARSVPTMYLRARWTSGTQVASLHWANGNGSFEDHRAVIAPALDERLHTYKIKLRGLVGYSGTITGLMLRPVSVDRPGTEVDIACLSWRPCPVDKRAEAAIVASTVPYLDAFDGPLDLGFWRIDGNGPWVAQANGGLEIEVPAATRTDLGPIQGGLFMRCALPGDFDAQVDYKLLDWPANNGVHLNFGTNYPEAVGRQNLGGEVVFAWFPPLVVNQPLADQAGSLRLVRRGQTISGYVLGPGGWRWLLIADASYGDTSLQLSVSSLPDEFAHQHVRVAFDNFRINSGRLVC